MRKSLLKWLWQNKILLIFLVVTIILDYFYGPLLYAKVFGLEDKYVIGKACSVSLVDCQNTYFSNYVIAVDQVSNAPRTYFSNIIIQQDQAGYTGNCPCPWDTDSRGYGCGGRSSYSRGGSISYCYDSDVSDAQVAAEQASQLATAKANLNDAVQSDLNVYHEKYTLLLIIIIYCWVYFYLKNKKKKVE